MYTDPSGYTWGIFKPFVQAAEWASKNVGTVLTAAYLGATAVACVFVPPLGGAMLGAYVGGLTANGGQLNMGKWDYKSSETWLSIGFGAAFGALGGYGIANPGSVAVKFRYILPGVGALGFNFDKDFSFQWETNAGGSGEVSRSEGGINIGTSVAWLNENAGASYLDAKGKCATYVISALVAGGANYRIPTVYAKDFGPTLMDMGFTTVNVGSWNYNAQSGDVAILQPWRTHTSGHMQMYNGIQWVSDYKQGDYFWPWNGSIGANDLPNFTIYRLP